MTTQMRRAEIHPTETKVVEKRKMGQYDIVQGHQELELGVEVEEALGNEIGEGGSDVEMEMGLLPWWPSDMIDEQMSWSMVWLPNWDAEFVGRAYHLLYGDVAWDDDIWGLKSIHQIPTSGNQY